MAISQTDLRNAARQSTRMVAKSTNQRTAFLCHSHKDRDLAEGLQVRLKEQGFDLYIDWQDVSMPATPNAETADKLRFKIVACDWFLFLATANSMASRWCPWELGYADGKKSRDRIAIVPTSDHQTTHGNEYIALYRYIDSVSGGRIGMFGPSPTQGVWVNSL
jgi:TIR domain